MTNDKFLNQVKKLIYIEFCKNLDLVRHYSEQGIEDKIKTNIKRIHVNGNGHDFYAGFYQREDDTITICLPITTVDSFSIDNNKLETLLHEAVHAFFRHKDGTGLLKFLSKTSSTEFSEIGRGINEGFTNWVVEHCALKTSSYSLLTNINMQLEHCIGRQKMINFGEGDYSQIFSDLNMNREQGIAFFRLLDEVYAKGSCLSKLTTIKRCLECQAFSAEKKKNNVVEDKNDKEQWEKDLDAVSYAIENSDLQGLDFLDKEFFENMQERISKLSLKKESNQKNDMNEYLSILELLDEKQLKLDNEYLNPIKKELGLMVTDIETKILNSLVIGKMDSPKNVQEFRNVMQLIGKIEWSLNYYHSEHPLEFDNLRQKLETKREIAVKNFYSMVAKSIRRGSVKNKHNSEILKIGYKGISNLFPSSRRYSSYSRKIQEDEIKRKYLDQLVKSVCNKYNNPEDNYLLAKYALKTGQINRIKQFSIKRTSTGKGIIFENGKLKTIITKDQEFFVDVEDPMLHEGENIQSKFEWTTDLSTDYEKIIHQFENLKAKKLAQNPNLQIQIMNRTIVFSAR